MRLCTRDTRLPRITGAVDNLARCFAVLAVGKREGVEATAG
jgi:hypothetical protein